MSPRFLVTHNGTFHLDDVMAYAILRMALPDLPRLVRTRDASVIASANIVWDVGLVHDAANLRFDHHQADAPRRPNGTPFSAAGLVWQHFGRTAIANCLNTKQCPIVALVEQALDQQLIMPIDEMDNGVTNTPGALHLSAIIADLNLRWDQPHSQAAEDDAFHRAAELASTVLRQRIYAEAANQEAMGIIHGAYVTGADHKILELPQKLPWQEAVIAFNMPTLYAVYPTPSGQWMVDTMPRTLGSIDQRLPLPLVWAGLPQAELAVASAVPDAIFVHPRRFIGAAGTRDGALAMARKAVEIGKSEATGVSDDVPTGSYRPIGQSWY